MVWRRAMTVALLLGGLAAPAGCQDEAASRDAKLIQRKVAELNEAQAAASARGRPGAGDPELCRGVSEGDMAAVEERMKHLNGELVVLGADQMRALQCSRSRQGY
jgi:hypothetical protein